MYAGYEFHSKCLILTSEVNKMQKIKISGPARGGLHKTRRKRLANEILCFGIYLYYTLLFVKLS